MNSLQTWIKSGVPWVWLNAAAVTASITLVAGLLLLIAARGLGHFDGRAVPRANSQGAVHHKLHVARAAGLVTGGRDLLRDVTGRNEPLGD